MDDFRIENPRVCEHGCAPDDECLICDDELMQNALNEWKENKGDSLVDGQIDFHTLRELIADAYRFRQLLKVVELERPDFHKFTWYLPRRILFQGGSQRDKFIGAVDGSIGFNFKQWLEDDVNERDWY